MKYLIIALCLCIATPVTAKEIMKGPYRAIGHEVYDGDTFTTGIHIWLGQIVRTRIRINGIDAPELRSKCETEKIKARASKQALIRLLTSNVELRNIKYGKWAGRVVADVFIDGENIADIMVDLGYARRYDGKSKRKPWCYQTKSGSIVIMPTVTVEITPLSLTSAS